MTPSTGTILNEDLLEHLMLDWFTALGYEVIHGPDIGPGEPHSERVDYSQVILENRLRRSLVKLNPGVPSTAIDEAMRRLTRLPTADLVLNNQAFHRMLVGPFEIEVSIRGSIRGIPITIIDFSDPNENEWLALNQYSVKESRRKRRADIVIFVNGLPIGLVELKNPADEDTDIWKAFNQIQTYKHDVPGLLAYNEVLVISDGIGARLGSITAPRERFQPWRTIEGEEVAAPTENPLEVLARGVFEKNRFLDLIHHFVVFESGEKGGLIKKIAAYHQFHATRKAVAKTMEAAAPGGDGRAGVVWHTQGSGKSLTMAFSSGMLIAAPEMANPTIVVITDRNDLDDQLFGVFTACSDLLRQIPEQASDRAQLKNMLQVASGGVYFTTIQKFLPDVKGESFPALSERRNIIVIADEAHRTQYGFVEGFARHMREALPNATFIAFTGTPIESEDRDTRSVFGNYIDVYDIERAVRDEATVPIYYESRLAKLDLDAAEVPTVDQELEEVTEGEEEARIEKIKTKWAQLEAVVGTERRLEMVAEDLIAHFEDRLSAMEGKAMIVCMSRRICNDLYDEIVKLRPEWHSEDDSEGEIKVVMTGSASDPVAWQKHIRSKSAREDMAQRFKDPNDKFRVVIVRDMWLTGFDAPSLHTMYLDKPMRGHTLMQAIARVNRVFRDKPGGLVVDYLGIADDLRKALAIYTSSGGKGEPALDIAAAVTAMIERYEICRALLHGFDYSEALTSGAKTMELLPFAQEHILEQDNGKERFIDAALGLSKAFALAAATDEASAIRDHVRFFQAVKAALLKRGAADAKTDEELNLAVRQIVSGAIAPEGVIDIFEAAGLPKPDISVLSDEFLADVKDMPQRNLAVEVLQKLLDDEIRARGRRNIVQGRRFSEMLENTVRRYKARAIETAQVIEELIAIAKEVREAQHRGELLGLSEDELAFYDALETNDSAVAVLGDEELRKIARELTEVVRRNTTIDWTVKESVRANLRRLVRRILRQHGYPPDKQEQATQTVLKQAEQLGFEFAEEPEIQEPFTVIPSSEAVPFDNCLPLYDLAAAAGAFSEAEVPEVVDWVIPHGRTTPKEGLFVAKVEGESMNRRIPSGSYCIFRHPVTGTRQQRVVLAQSRHISDPEHGGRYTVKIYQSSKSESEEGPFSTEVRLLPDSDDPRFEPLVLHQDDEADLTVIAEFIEVL